MGGALFRDGLAPPIGSKLAFLHPIGIGDGGRPVFAHFFRTPLHSSHSSKFCKVFFRIWCPINDMFYSFNFLRYRRGGSGQECLLKGWDSYFQQIPTKAQHVTGPLAFFTTFRIHGSNIQPHNLYYTIHNLPYFYLNILMPNELYYRPLF